MAVMTTERLSATVGARVEGVTPDQLATDDALAGWCLQALEESGVLVFPDVHVDDATQVAFSRKLGDVEAFDPRDMHRTTFVGDEPIR